MNRKRKILISFVLSILGIVLIIVGIIFLNTCGKEKIITYYCSISSNQKSSGIVSSIEEYNFTVDLTENKFLLSDHNVVNFYENEEIFNDASKKIADLMEENPDNNVEYIYFNQNLSINKSVKEILYENTIDYSKKNWLNDYIDSIKKVGYSCISIKNKK